MYDRCLYVRALLEGIADSFFQVVKSTPDLQYVLHMASPFHYNVQDPVKDFLEPAITGSTSILKAVKDFAPSVKRVVLTSSFAALRNDSKPAALIDESSWNPVTWDEAVENKRKTYQGSKASLSHFDMLRTYFETSYSEICR